ncbi:MAG: transcriptional regulator, TetR family [Frankiales bacterium]|nr:transcriptional regulator, TetR family [Frankiales bacterium]
MSAARPLSRDRILKAAFAIADKRGLEAVTMRSVAARLDVEAMSLYHHVPSKRAMLNGLVDLLVQMAEMPTGEVTSEEWIRGTASGLRALAQQHPRVVGLLSSRTVPLDDPESAKPFEAGLAAFVREGRDLPQAYAAVQSVALAVLSMTQLESIAALETPTPPDATHVEALSDDFPLLRQVAESDVTLDLFWAAMTEGLVRGFAA